MNLCLNQSKDYHNDFSYNVQEGNVTDAYSDDFFCYLTALTGIMSTP